MRRKMFKSGKSRTVTAGRYSITSDGGWKRWVEMVVGLMSIQVECNSNFWNVSRNRTEVQ